MTQVESKLRMKILYLGFGKEREPFLFFILRAPFLAVTLFFFLFPLCLHAGLLPLCFNVFVSSCDEFEIIATSRPCRRQVPSADQHSGKMPPLRR